MALSFEVMFFEEDNETSSKYENYIRIFIAQLLEVEYKDIDVQQKEAKQMYRDLNCNICRLNGSVNSAVKERSLFETINVYCEEGNSKNAMISVGDSVLQKYSCFKSPLKSFREQTLNSISFGTIVNLNQFVSHIEFGENCDDVNAKSLKAIFEFYRKKLMLQFFSPSHYRFEVDLSAINYVILSKTKGTWVIYLVLLLPALLYEATNVQSSSQFLSKGQQIITQSWSMDMLRKVTVNDEQRNNYSAEDIDPKTFTKSNVIRIQPSIDAKLSDKEQWNRIWSLIMNMKRFSNVSVYFGNVGTVFEGLRNPCLPQPCNLPFNVHYAFHCVESCSFQLHDELFVKEKKEPNSIRRFMETIEKYAKIDKKAAEEALYDLFYLKDNNIPIDSFHALEMRFNERRNKKQTLNSNMVEIRRCTVTPTRIIFLPPLPYLKSRLLRNSDPDFVLKVNVKDDNFSSLNFTVLSRSRRKVDSHLQYFFDTKITDIVANGIKIKNRKYEYLGGSTSQMKDFGMIFYAVDGNCITAGFLRSQIGDLSHIKNPGKYIARIGQAFSQPIAYTDVSTEKVTVEPDIIGGWNRYTKKPYVFSDGVGMISKELAKKFTSLIDKERKISYSAFQIRYGGSKGMVVIYPPLKGERMILRESMKKYESDSLSVDIIKASEPRCLYLNRPFINLLDQLGVKHSVFLSIARREFRGIIEAFNCKCKALELIKSSSYLKIDFEAIKNSEINIFREPFFVGMLELIVKQKLDAYKSKMRFQLPPETARTMFGVLDETRSLEEGEVFIQYSQMDNYMDRRVYTGDVLVSKFPCMHPGDVRKFKAIDVPHLHDICDCIVFPQQGSRPHPDQMAGSDLDGDEYAVIWDPRFFFPGHNHEPMEYQINNGSPSEQKNVQVIDMLEFYIDFLQKSNVGLIADRHLALSDQLSKGIFDEQCLSLARQYSIALDFAKSGVSENERIVSTDKFPDFMQKSEYKATYKSNRALGKLYRLCCLFEENTEMDMNFISTSIDPNLVVEGWQKYEKEAEVFINKFKSKMVSIQRQFGAEDELSLITGISLDDSKYFQSRNEKYDSKSIIRLRLKQLADEFRELFHISFPGTNKQEVKAIASALYLVTDKLNQQTPKTQYTSLPWIFANILSTISGNKKHVCDQGYAFDRDLIDASRDFQSEENLRGEIECDLAAWLTMNCQRVVDVDFDGTFNKQFEKLSSTIGNVLLLPHTIESAMVQIMECIAETDSDDEFENVLALSALLNLNRFRKTGVYESFIQSVNSQDEEKETTTVCIAIEDRKFKKYIENATTLRRMLLDDGVDDVSFHIVNTGSLFVSAIGKKLHLKKLRNNYFSRLSNIDLK